MVDDPTRTAFEIALRAALRDQARANATVEFLREKLGMAEASGAIVLGPGDADREDDGPRDVGPVQVTDSEFYGLSQTKAAALYLERAGRTRPQRTEAIISALKKGGIEFNGKDPAQTFYAILARTPAFHRVGKSTWGLSVWYPNAAKKVSKANVSATPAPEDGLSVPPTGSSPDTHPAPEEAEAQEN